MLIPGLNATWVDQQTMAATQSDLAPVDVQSDLNNITEAGQRLVFKGRYYTVKENDDLTWRFEEDACHPLACFYHAIVDRITDGSINCRETQLANTLLDHAEPARTVIPIRKESELSAVGFGQRFNFEGRNYTVKRTIQGHWRAVEDESHPLHAFFCAITDRIEDLTFCSREHRLSLLLDNSKMPVIRVRRQRDFYKINHAGDRFNFNGRNYVVTAGTKTLWRIREESVHPLYSFFNGIVDRIVDLSLSSRLSRLSQIVIPPFYRSFHADLNSTLWYVALKKQDLHPALREHFYEESIVRGQEITTVLVSKDLLAFLGEQYQLGAKISIASTGKTSPNEKGAGGTLDNLIARHGVEDQDFGFMAGKDFMRAAESRGLWFQSKPFLKYRILGAWDGDRHNILIDDCWYQTWAPWFHTINSNEFFGMGSVQKLRELSARLHAETAQTNPKPAPQFK